MCMNRADVLLSTSLASHSCTTSSYEAIKSQYHAKGCQPLKSLRLWYRVHRKVGNPNEESAMVCQPLYSLRLLA
jgi:hypothetical protein